MNDTQYVEDYSRFRNLEEPNELECLVFLVTEVGEMLDAWINENPEMNPYSLLLLDVSSAGENLDLLIDKQKSWVRNHEHKNVSVEDEMGDVLMMLTKFASRRGTNPSRAMLDKFRKKGYEPTE